MTQFLVLLLYHVLLTKILQFKFMVSFYLVQNLNAYLKAIDIRHDYMEGHEKRSVSRHI